MQNRPPAARRARRHIFRPVVKVDDFLAASPGEFFQRLVDFRSPVSSRPPRTNKCSRQNSGRTENSDGCARWPDRWCSKKCNVLNPRRRNSACSSIIGAISVKMSAKNSAEFLKLAAESRWLAGPGRKIPAASAGPIRIPRATASAKKKCSTSGRRQAAPRGDARDGNRIIEIHQHLAQIKNDNSRFHSHKEAQKSQKEFEKPIQVFYLRFLRLFAANQSIHFPAAFQRAAQGQFVGKFQSAAGRQSVGDARDFQARCAPAVWPDNCSWRHLPRPCPAR